MSALFMTTLAALGFSGANLLALLGGGVNSRVRSYLLAIAAGIMVSLAFGDLFPEGLEWAGKGAILGFIGGFAFLFSIETFLVHARYPPGGRIQEFALAPFVVGFVVHNFAEGFALAVSAETSAVAVGAVALGVILHKIPEGLSVAAVMAATNMNRGRVAAVAILLGLLLPAAAVLTLAVPSPSVRSLGILSGIAGGALAYMGAAHLLPEAGAERPDGLTSGILFLATLALTTIGLFTVL